MTKPHKAHVALLLAALLALPLWACGGESAEEWENTWGELTIVDFAAHTEVGGADVYSPADLHAFGSYVLAEGDVSARGVAIGDSPEKVAALYAGVECAVMDGAEPEHDDGEDELTELYTDFAAYLGGEELARGSIGVTYCWYVIHGLPLGLGQFRAYAAAGEPLDEVEGYSLTYLFQRGKVSGIYLDYARVGDMIEDDGVLE